MLSSPARLSSGVVLVVLGMTALSLITLSVPGRVEAQGDEPPQILGATIGSNGNDVVLGCYFTSFCAPSGDCDVGTCEMIGVDQGVCLPPSRDTSYETFCCETLDDCPDRHGVAAFACSRFGGDLSVCRYRGAEPVAQNFCVGEGVLLLQDVVRCVTNDFDANQASLQQGDCDGDDVPNIDDATPCGDITFDFDLGVDSGTTRGDADSGTTGASGVAFQGGGGCSGCVVTRSRPHALGLLLLGVALLWRRGRRGRRRAP